MLATEELNNLTRQLGYANIEDAAIKQIELSLLGKISKYKAEDDFYRNKYQSDYKTFLGKNTSEIFEIEDDLLEWKFAVDSLEKYREQIRSISK